jgi:hypothetical protein
MTREPLTSTTWADLKGFGLLPREQHERLPLPRLGWQAESDLEYELVTLSATAKELGGWKRSLTLETARALVSACHSGYPVMVTWDTVMSPLHFGERHIERKQTAVIVDQIMPPSGNQPGYMRVHYCGFGHLIWFHEVVEAHAFDTVITWHSPEEN